MRIYTGLLLAMTVAGCAAEVADTLGGSGERSKLCSVQTPYGPQDIEAYLKQVVNCEAWSEEPEALKAVTVAARSYVYYHIAQGNDVVGDSQAYQVMSCGKEVPAHVADAVEATCGLVLRYQGMYVIGFHAAGHPVFHDSIDGREIYCDRTLDYGDNPDNAINSEQYVTRNWGLSGNDIYRRENGQWTSNPVNRGGLSQNGARCLAQNAWSFASILQYYYGMDIEVTPVNSCDFASCADESSGVPMWETPECKNPSLVQAPAGAGGAPAPQVSTAVQSCDGAYENLLASGQYFSLGTVTDGLGLLNGRSQSFSETLKAGETHLFEVIVQDKVFWDQPTPFVSIVNETDGSALQMSVRYEDADTNAAISQACQGQLAEWGCVVADHAFVTQVLSVTGAGANQGDGKMAIQIMPGSSIPADSCIRYTLKYGG